MSNWDIAQDEEQICAIDGCSNLIGPWDCDICKRPLCPQHTVVLGPEESYCPVCQPKLERKGATPPDWRRLRKC